VDSEVAGALGRDFATVKYRQTPDRRFLRGDCNGDGSTIGVSDAVFSLTYSFLGGAEPPCVAACDANGDAVATGVSDAVYLLAFSFLGGPAPVLPYPDCGPPGPRDPDMGCAVSHGACR